MVLSEMLRVSDVWYVLTTTYCTCTCIEHLTLNTVQIPTQQINGECAVLLCAEHSTILIL